MSASAARRKAPARSGASSENTATLVGSTGSSQPGGGPSPASSGMWSSAGGLPSQAASDARTSGSSSSSGNQLRPTVPTRPSITEITKSWLDSLTPLVVAVLSAQRTLAADVSHPSAMHSSALE